MGGSIPGRAMPNCAVPLNERLYRRSDLRFRKNGAKLGGRLGRILDTLPGEFTLPEISDAVEHYTFPKPAPNRASHVLREWLRYKVVEVVEM